MNFKQPFVIYYMQKDFLFLDGIYGIYGIYRTSSPENYVNYVNYV
jgi:hypothetical protein